MHNTIKKIFDFEFLGNPFKVNLLLLLGLTVFAIGGIDLGSELSIRNDEINFVMDSLEDITTTLSTCANTITAYQPLIALIGNEHCLYTNSQYSSLTKDRSPPQHS